MEKAVMIFTLVFITFLMSLTPPFAQWNLYEIDADRFKKVRIKHLSFLFRGIGGKDCIYGNVKEYGVILPMFIYQVSGYCSTILSWIAIPILYYIVGLPLDIVAGIIIGVFLAECLALMVIVAICVIKSKSKTK